MSRPHFFLSVTRSIFSPLPKPIFFKYVWNMKNQHCHFVVFSTTPLPALVTQIMWICETFPNVSRCVSYEKIPNIEHCHSNWPNIAKSSLHTKSIWVAFYFEVGQNCQIRRLLVRRLGDHDVFGSDESSGYTRTRNYPPEPDFFQYPTYPNPTFKKSGISEPSRIRLFPYPTHHQFII